jgi:hypothetical protein
MYQCEDNLKDEEKKCKLTEYGNKKFKKQFEEFKKKALEADMTAKDFEARYYFDEETGNIGDREMEKLYNCTEDKCVLNTEGMEEVRLSAEQYVKKWFQALYPDKQVTDFTPYFTLSAEKGVEYTDAMFKLMKEVNTRHYIKELYREVYQEEIDSNTFDEYFTIKENEVEYTKQTETLQTEYAKKIKDENEKELAKFKTCVLDEGYLLCTWPFSEHKDKIKEYEADVLKLFGPKISSLADIKQADVEKVLSVKEKYAELQELLHKIVNAPNEIILPIEKEKIRSGKD